MICYIIAISLTTIIYGILSRDISVYKTDSNTTKFLFTYEWIFTFVVMNILAYIVYLTL